MNVDHKILDAFEKTYRLFLYKADQPVYGKDDWRSHAQSVREGRFFEDDCDGFAITCADLLLEQGYKPELWICSVPLGQGRHMVCQVDGLILDNRYPGIRTIKEAERGSLYRWARRIDFRKYRED